MVLPEQPKNQNQNVKGGKSQVDFSSGWQPNIYPQLEGGSGLRDVLNFELATQFPNPRKSRGYAPWNSSATQISGQAAIYWMDMLYDGAGDNDYVLAAREDPSGGSTNLWAAERTSRSPTILDSGLSVNALQNVRFNVGSKQWVYIVGAGNLKTDGSNTYTVGNIGPSVGFTATDNGTGSIDGTTKVRVAYVYGDFGESNAGDSVQVSVSSGNVKIDSLPTSSSNLVTKRKIYRTDERTFKGRSGEDYWLAKEVADNTTSTTTLTTTGSVIIANQSLPADNSQIPEAQISEKFANRVFYAGGNIKKGRIIYSKELKPDQYEDPNNSSQPTVIDTIRGEDGLIMAMGGARTKLYIVTAQNVWVLNGRTPSNWSFNRVHNVGTRSPDSVKVIDGLCYFVGSDLENIYRTDGRQIEPIGQPIKNFLTRSLWDSADQFWAIHDTKKDTYRLHLRHRDASKSQINEDDRFGEMIDDFEDNDLSEYNKDIATSGSFSVVDVPVLHGSKSLEGFNDAGNTKNTVISPSGLKNYPVAGDVITFWIRADSGSASEAGFLFAQQGTTNSADGYQAQVNLDGKILLIKDKRIAESTSAAINTEVWYKGIVDWGKNGNITFTLQKRDGSQVAQVTRSDSDYTSGGVGLLVGTKTSLSGGEKWYLDLAKRR